MAIQQFAGYKIYIDGYDRSGDFNKVNLDYSADELDSTSVADTSEFIAGLKNVSSMEIFVARRREAETTHTQTSPSVIR